MNNSISQLPEKTINRTDSLDSYLDDVIADYTHALEMEPQSPIYYRKRGSAYFKKGDWQAAIADYNKSLETSPDDLTTYIQLAETHHKVGDLDAAISAYSKAIELDPNDPMAYLGRFEVFRQKKDHSAASKDLEQLGRFRQANYKPRRSELPAITIADFYRALEMTPKDAQDFVDRGDAYLNKWDFETTLQNYAQELMSVVNCGWNMSQSCTTQLDPAIDVYTKELEKDPQNTRIYTNRGNAFLLKGALDEAIADYDLALRYDPYSPLVILYRGNAYFKKGDLEKASADYAHIIKRDPSMVDAILSLGNIYFNQKDYERAIVEYTQALEVDPQCVEALFNRGQANLNLGKREAFAADKRQAEAIDEQLYSKYQYAAFKTEQYRTKNWASLIFTGIGLIGGVAYGIYVGWTNFSWIGAVIGALVGALLGTVIGLFLGAVFSA